VVQLPPAVGDQAVEPLPVLLAPGVLQARAVDRGGVAGAAQVDQQQVPGPLQRPQHRQIGTLGPAGAHPGLAGPLAVASFDDAPDVAYLDNAIAGQIVENADDVAALTLLYDVLRGEALSCQESEALLREAMETWT